MSEGGFDVEAYRRNQQGNPDKALLVSFEWVAERDKSGEYQNVPYIRIWMDKNSEIVRKATEEDKVRFADRWEAFEKNEETPEDGTPIKEMPLATPANVAACKAERILTVEQLVETPDERLQRAHLINFKYVCRDWLEARGRNGYLKEMRDQIEALKAENQALKDKFREAGIPAEVKPKVTKKRGRPRKNVQEPA